jgi:GNAT superfamily N-acetyltransferase
VIRELSEGELPGAAALAAAAFREDPGFAHILPDDALRRRRLPSLFEAMLRVDALAGGRVSGAFEDDALIGLSSIIPAGAENPGIPEWLKHLPSLAWFLGEPAALLRAAALIRAVAERRTKESDYLHLLAVHPATQGRGVGAALLNAAPKALYLETFEERNASWYEARGFRRIAEIRSPVRPVFWTLRRG